MLENCRAGAASLGGLSCSWKEGEVGRGEGMPPAWALQFSLDLSCPVLSASPSHITQHSWPPHSPQPPAKFPNSCAGCRGQRVPTFLLKNCATLGCAVLLRSQSAHSLNGGVISPSTGYHSGWGQRCQGLWFLVTWSLLDPQVSPRSQHPASALAELS